MDTQFRFEAIGTQWTIELFQKLDDPASDTLQAKIMARIEAFDKNYSRFRADSLITRMAQRAGKYELPADAEPLFDTYRTLYETTGGAVTPLIGQALSDAGYDASYSLTPGTVTAPPAWDDVMDYDYPILTLRKPALLDLGAAGKGYLADIIARLLDAEGITIYCVNAGGDFVCKPKGDRPLDIALEHPTDPSQAIGVAHLYGGSLCGSAGNRRSWDKYTHILDPHTLRSPKDIQAIWVSAASGLIADGLTTALFFVEPDKLRQHFDFEYAIIRGDTQLEHSAHFPAEFFGQHVINQD